MLSIVRCPCSHPDFVALIGELDAGLRAMYGSLQDILDLQNLVSDLSTGVVAYADGMPAGCGCIREYNSDAVEIKRMFVKPEKRRQGISSRILTELEKWAVELGFAQALIETGAGQTEAIALYTKSGYRRTANFGPFADMGDSVCLAKDLKKRM